MPKVIYSLDSAIDSFFSEAGASSSRAQCDDFARQRCGGQAVQPVDIQGATSYTVIAGLKGDMIIQFREQTALLDMKALALAKEIHGDVVPRCLDLGCVGDASGSPLAIYEMDRLPGENYIITRSDLERDEQLNTIYSLAKLVNPSISPFYCLNILTWE